jgi:polygalacturonase
MFEIKMGITRRTFVINAAGAAGAGYLAAQSKALDWQAQAAAILARIKPPQFPNREFEITKYGVSNPIAKAIDACSAAGGGRVVIPRGEHLTGAIRLKSNVNLYVSEGATLKFSRDPKDYPTVYTRFEGVECMNYSPFIYAFEQSNIAITGTGTLDGQADKDNWWLWKGKSEDRNALFAMGAKGTPVAERVFGLGRTLRPNFIQPNRSQNVLIEGVTIVNSPMWEVHPVLSRNVTVRNVSINSHGPNNDGCDPESCSDVHVVGCTFDTGDDCIAIKSGRNEDGRRVNAPCENLVIENCNMKDGHGGVSIGSELSGGVRNVFIRDCKMSSPHLQRALRIKTNSYRGGYAENVAFHNITVGEVANDVIQLDYYYEEGPGGPFHPMIRNVDVGEVTCEKSMYPLNMRGYASDPIFEISVSNCKFNGAAKAPLIENVKGLRLTDVTVNGKPWNA